MGYRGEGELQVRAAGLPRFRCPGEHELGGPGAVLKTVLWKTEQEGTKENRNAYRAGSTRHNNLKQGGFAFPFRLKELLLGN